MLRTLLILGGLGLLLALLSGLIWTIKEAVLEERRFERFQENLIERFARFLSENAPLVVGVVLILGAMGGLIGSLFQ